MTPNEPDTRNQRILRIEPTPRGLLNVVIAVAIVWAAIKLTPVLLVLVGALFLVGTLTPAIEALERRGWRRTRGIALVFGALFVLSGALVVLMVPALVDQLSTLVEQEPALREKVATFFARSGATAPLAEGLRNVQYAELVKSSMSSALEYSTRALELMAYLASAIFLALYIMLDRDRLRGGLFAVVPRTHHIRLSRVLLNLETIVGGYIRGQVLTSALMTAFTFALLLACGVKNALAIAVFTGLADVLPYLGVFLSVGAAVAAASSKGVVVILIVLILMLVYEEFESRFLVPKIYGNALRLPSSVVLFALLAGGVLMGITGALLALPAAAACRMLVEELRVALPGEDVPDSKLRARDERAEEEYERRAEGVPAVAAAAIAVEISEERIEEEGGKEHAPSVPITSGEDPGRS